MQGGEWTWQKKGQMEKPQALHILLRHGIFLAFVRTPASTTILH